MNAKEARRISEQAARQKQDGGFLVKYAHGKIEAAATRGEREVLDPFVGLRTIVVAAQITSAIAAMKEEGYTFTPRDDGRLVVSW